MFTVKLKNNQTVEIPLEQLEVFLEENRDKIEIRHKKMEKRRVSLEYSQKRVQSNSDNQESIKEVAQFCEDDLQSISFCPRNFEAFSR